MNRSTTSFPATTMRSARFACSVRESPTRTAKVPVSFRRKRPKRKRPRRLLLRLRRPLRQLKPTLRPPTSRPLYSQSRPTRLRPSRCLLQSPSPLRRPRRARQPTQAPKPVRQKWQERGTVGRAAEPSAQSVAERT